MLAPYLFIAFSVLVALSSILIFVTKRILHAVVALTLVFAEAAIIFFALDQVMLALLQLLVFVGGLATYLIVAIAAEEHISKMDNVPLLFALSLVFFVGMFTIIFYLPSMPAQQSNSLPALAPAVFQDYYALLYLITILLFAGTVGSALVARRFVRLVM